MEKTKFMITARDLQTLQTSGKYPCAVCRKGNGKSSIFCSACLFWVHKKCSDVPGKLVEDPDFRCKRCLGTAQAIDGRLCTEVQLDAVDNFVYPDDCICPGGGFELATIKRCHSALGRLENSCPCLLVKQFL